jgi:carbon starvation protein CstA
MITVFLAQNKKPFYITLIPALFMTTVCSTFLFVSKQAFGMDQIIGYSLGGVVLVVALVWFFVWYKRQIKELK